MSRLTERVEATIPEECAAYLEGVPSPLLVDADNAVLNSLDADKLLPVYSDILPCLPIKEDMYSVIELSDIDDSLSDFTQPGYAEHTSFQHTCSANFTELTHKNSFNSVSVSGEDFEMLFGQTWKIVESVN